MVSKKYKKTLQFHSHLGREHVLLLLGWFYLAVSILPKKFAKYPAFKLYFQPSVMVFAVECLGGLQASQVRNRSSFSVCQKICVLSVISVGCEDVFPRSILTSLYFMQTEYLQLCLVAESEVQPRIYPTIHMHSTF